MLNLTYVSSLVSKESKKMKQNKAGVLSRPINHHAKPRGLLVQTQMKLPSSFPLDMERMLEEFHDYQVAISKSHGACERKGLRDARSKADVKKAF
jgi:hypothetical protein